MSEKKRKYVDWGKTAKNLKLLRCDNMNLRRFVCRKLNYNKNECDGNCDGCKFDMDESISQIELAKAFDVSSSMVVNWENGKSKPSVEDLLFYADVCEITLEEVLVTRK